MEEVKNSREDEVKVCVWCNRTTWPILKQGQHYGSLMCEKHYNQTLAKAVVDRVMVEDKVLRGWVIQCVKCGKQCYEGVKDYREAEGFMSKCEECEEGIVKMEVMGYARK